MPAIAGVAELGKPDQWQKCLLRKARMGEEEEQDSQEVEGAMGRTL